MRERERERESERERGLMAATRARGRLRLGEQWPDRQGEGDLERGPFFTLA